MGGCSASCPGDGGKLDDTGGGTTHLVVSAIIGDASSVSFVPLSQFAELPLPYPRRQDSKLVVRTPEDNDTVVCVSHAWPYQAHPDPTGDKAKVIGETFRQVERVYTNADPLVFFDYVSVTQEPRRGRDEKLFIAALAAMPMIYLRADAVVHIEQDLPAVPGDGEEVTVPAVALRSASLREIKGSVQFSAVPAGQKDVRENYTLGSVDGAAVAEAAVARQLLGSGSSAVVRKTPYGLRNMTQAGDRGWIFLERFCSMAKVAMVAEEDAERVVFSNSPAVLKQIFAGGDKLRKAAQEGSEELAQALGEFGEELRGKSFSGTSTDAAKGATRRVHGAAQGGAELEPEAEMVFEIMGDCVKYLREHWAEEKRKQVQRALATKLMQMSAGEHHEAALQGVRSAEDAVELTYFPLIGRGEYIILMCLENDIPLHIPEFNGNFGPTGTVPTLRHGDTELWDSNAIVQYLIERFPGPCSPPAEHRIKALDWWSVLQDYYSFVLSPMHDIIMGLPKRNLRLTDQCRACGAPHFAMDGKDTMSGKLIDLHIQRTTYMENVLVKQGSQDYFCGVFCYVDLMMYTFVTAIDKCKGFQGFRDAFKKIIKKDDCFGHCPTIRKICSNVGGREKVAAREHRYPSCDI